MPSEVTLKVMVCKKRSLTGQMTINVLPLIVKFSILFLVNQESLSSCDRRGALATQSATIALALLPHHVMSPSFSILL
jgi:hypothetical protein